MHIRDVFRRRGTTFSFELFAPRTRKGWAGRFDAVRRLEAPRPDFVSATYGAGDGTRQLIPDLGVRKDPTRLEPIPHLTCVARRRRGVHFFTLNRSTATVEIFRTVGFGGRAPRETL